MGIAPSFFLNVGRERKNWMDGLSGRVGVGFGDIRSVGYLGRGFDTCTPPSFDIFHCPGTASVEDWGRTRHLSELSRPCPARQ